MAGSVELSMKRVGRNDPCPCGSGLRYKKCHMSQDAKKMSSSTLVGLVIGAVAVAALIGVAMSARNGSRPAARSVASSPATPMTAAPGRAVPAPLSSTPQPGPAPPGKVWSAEHGHWHDVPGSTTPATATTGTTVTSSATPSAPVPQPPGPVPAGKIWSPEHGHWHDLPPATPATGTPATGTSSGTGGQ